MADRSKECEICKKTFYIPKRNGITAFNNARFCSRKCGGVHRKGKSPHGWTEEQKQKMRIKKTGTIMSEKTRDKMRKSAKKGKENNKWNGGISKIDKICRKMLEYKRWRELVFLRDKYTCRGCGNNKCYVTAHHIESFSGILKNYKIINTEQARDCSDLWDINNGLTLCEDCHKLTDNYKGRVHKQTK